MQLGVGALVSRVLHHDIARFSYLVQEGRIPVDLFEGAVIPVYRKLMGALAANVIGEFYEMTRAQSRWKALQARHDAARRYNDPSDTPLGAAIISVPF